MNARTGEFLRALQRRQRELRPIAEFREAYRAEWTGAPTMREIAFAKYSGLMDRSDIR